MTEAATPDPRRLLGRVVAERYRVDALVGEGGMGAVYRATHLATREAVALKVLNADMLGIEEAKERFEREAIAGAHIRHPNVTAASDFGKLEDGSHYLALEFLDGDDLRSVVAQGPLPLGRALGIASQIAGALAASHALGIVHRDLKPENVMLVRRDGRDDVVKLFDFGIAKVPVDALGPKSGSTARVLTQLGMVYGTPEYMAPEQALGQEIDGRADQYALGVVLYEMLSGSRPFDAPDRATLLAKVTAAAPPTLAERGIVGLPPGLESLVARLLEKRAADRFADAADVALAIDTVRGEPEQRPAPRAPARADEDSRPAPRARRGGMKDVPMQQPTLPGGRRPSLVDVATSYRGSLASIVELADSAPAKHPSAPIVLGVIGMGLIVLVVALAAALRSSETVIAMEALAASAAGTTPADVSAQPGEPSAPPMGVTAITSSRASEAELDAAKSVGLTALGPLAQKYPKDPVVLKALLMAYAADRSSFPSAMRVAKHLFDASPAAANDEEVRQVILMAANGTPEAAAAAFDVMTHLGGPGIDLVYELAVAPNVGKLPKDRATALLADEPTMAQASPALRIANELRIAQACQRKPLLAKAAADGDARALHFLKPLQATSGCGIFHRSDCYGCFGTRKELNETIDAIEHRLIKK